MTWLTWRQFRAAAAMLFAALATLAAVLALTGPGLADDYATGIAACTTQPGGCSDFVPQFFDDHQGPLPGGHRRGAAPARPDRAVLGRAADRP